MIRGLILALVALPAAAFAQTNETTVYSFLGGADGNQPRGDVLLFNGKLYGTTSLGGTQQNGAVHAGEPASGTLTTLWQFSGAADGRFPAAGVIADNAGTLYGTTALDGPRGHGTVFSLTPPVAAGGAWTETILAAFAGNNDSATPMAPLTADTPAVTALFGTTRNGGSRNAGTVFALFRPTTPGHPWARHTLHSFTGGADGANPVAALVLGPDGTLYGTAQSGGSGNAGTVFALTHTGPGAWSFATLWQFTGGADGASPAGNLALGPGGVLYGTTQYGGGSDCGQTRWPYYGAPASQSDPALGAAYVPPGGNNCGVVFALTPPATMGGAWQQTVLWSFTGTGDGANPVAGVLPDASGALHGMTPEYGDPTANGLGEYGDKGNVFTIAPPATSGAGWTETTTLSFEVEQKGDYARGNLIPGASGYYMSDKFGGATWQHVVLYGYGAINFLN